MVDFNSDHKQELGSYFSEGIHKVKITAIVGGTTDQGKEYFEFSILGEDGEEGSARVWWTTDNATKYSFNTVKTIFVHNTPEARRDEIKKQIDNVKNTDELLDLCQALIGKEAWYSVWKSDRTYIDSKTGETKNSYDRNITGYEPSVPKDVARRQAEAELVAEGGKPLNLDDIPFN